MTPSALQLAIYDHALNDPAHLIADALAGSGKSTTLFGIVERLAARDDQESIAMVAFNTAIAQQLEGKLREAGLLGAAVVKTFHALGNMVCRKNVPALQDTYKGKTDDSIRLRVGQSEWARGQAKKVTHVVRRLTSLTKSNLERPTAESIERLVEHHNIEIEDTWTYADLAVLVTQVMADGIRNPTLVDFDDMMWIPAVELSKGRWTAPRFKYLLVDEGQDMNPAQFMLVSKCIAPGGKVILIGDRFQAIYGWRGAGVDALEKAEVALQAKRLPLSICYRCPTKVLDLARTLVPQIENAPGAPEGSVTKVSLQEAKQKMTEGDLVLCRANAPLLSVALGLVSKGRKVTIRGKDIGKDLRSRIERLRPESVTDLILKLRDYTAREVKVAIATDREDKVEKIVDSAACLEAITDGCASLMEVGARIDQVFSDDGNSGVIFSSVHKAKGLEFDRVWILNADRLPARYKKQQEWQTTQEKNLYYVAITRAKRELYLVQSLPRRKPDSDDLADLMHALEARALEHHDEPGPEDLF